MRGGAVLLSEVTSRVSRTVQRKGEPNGSHALKQQSWQPATNHRQTNIQPATKNNRQQTTTNNNEITPGNKEKGNWTDHMLWNNKPDYRHQTTDKQTWNPALNKDGRLDKHETKIDTAINSAHITKKKTTKLLFDKCSSEYWQASLNLSLWIWHASKDNVTHTWKTMGSRSEILFHEISDVQKILVGWTTFFLALKFAWNS